MEWQSMDTAPRDGRNILAEFAGGGAVVVCWRQLSTMFSSSHIQDYKADDCAWVTGMGHQCDNLALWIPEPSSKDRLHWQSIETAPKDGTEIDLWLISYEWPTLSFREADCQWEACGASDNHGFGWTIGGEHLPIPKGLYPTHWMHKPKPPKV